MPSDTKPRDAGEVAIAVRRWKQFVDNGTPASILTAWRREIEAAMVERIAAWAEDGWRDWDRADEYSDPFDMWGINFAEAIRARFGGGE